MNKHIIYIFLLAIILPTAAVAQRNKLRNQPKYDNKYLHFGINLGINYYDFQIREKANWPNIPGLYDMWTEVSPGYSIGIVSNLRLGNYFDLRFIPTFSATVRRLYVDLDHPFTGERVVNKYEITSSFIQFPFELKYKSERINNHRWYVAGGAEYSLDLASKEKVKDDTLFKLAKNNTALQASVGIDFYFEYFKFSPHLKATWGINNILVEDGTIPVSGIDGLYSRSIVISFTFE